MFWYSFDSKSQASKNHLFVILFVLASSRALLKNREFNDEQDDDEIFDPDEEANANVARVGTIPSVLKAVIKFGYEDTLKSALSGEDFDGWIAGVFTHTQAHFRHAASLGTTIEFEVCTLLYFKIMIMIA